MSRKQRSGRVGSTVTFIIAGVILFVMLSGAVYVLRQHGEQARKEQAIAAYDKQQADDKKAADDAARKASEAKADGESSDTASISGDEDVLTAELPITGPTAIVEEMIGGGFLAASIINYLLSRRNLSRSL